MTTGMQVAKLANLIRGKWRLMHLLAETYKPAISRNKVKLMEAIRDWQPGGRGTLIHELAETYKPTINRNKEKLMELIREKAEVASKSELARKMRVVKGYYTLEMAPPKSGEIKKLLADLDLAQQFIKTQSFKYLTVKQAWLLFLVCLEVSLWFYLGETIGKRHLVGYLV